jgi:hypothetical protein
VSVGISQSYYTDATAAAADLAYQSGSNPNRPPSHFSAVRLVSRVSPTSTTDATFTTEYDPQTHAMSLFAANGTLRKGWVQTTDGWSLNRGVFRTHTLNSATTVRKPGNAFGGTYTFNYDFQRKRYVQQRWIAYYNSQCCGIAVEYQSVNFGTLVSASGVPQDHRFNLSFTLAGIGTFSNLFGAFGGQTR